MCHFGKALSRRICCAVNIGAHLTSVFLKTSGSLASTSSDQTLRQVKDGVVGPKVGAEDGALVTVGAAVGRIDVVGDAVRVGRGEGLVDGAGLGTSVQLCSRPMVGAVVGANVAVGRGVGAAVGRRVLSSVGANDGRHVGAAVGRCVGARLVEGATDGVGVGKTVGFARPLQYPWPSLAHSNTTSAPLTRHLLRRPKNVGLNC